MEEMERNGVRPDVRTFSIFISKCLSKGKTDTAKQLLQKVKGLTTNDGLNNLSHEG